MAPFIALLVALVALPCAYDALQCIEWPLRLLLTLLLPLLQTI